MRSRAGFADGDIFANFLKHRSEERSGFRIEHASTPQNTKRTWTSHEQSMFARRRTECIPVWALKSQRANPAIPILSFCDP